MYSKCTKSKAPTVINDELLEECALKQYCKTEEAKRIAQEEGLDFSQIEILNLEFKNILKINNLWQFRNLRKLHLSNNVIECIEGLEELRNLVYLDLSFNNIQTITGLQNLHSLRDLSLSNNRIKKVENLEPLKNLELLSLKNNLIDDFINVQYLFTFGAVRSVAFKGNPIEADENYKLKVIAYVPSLSYVDCRLISEEEKAEASKLFKSDIERLSDKAKAWKQQQDEIKEVEETKALHKEASLENLGYSQLLQDILNSHHQSHLLLTYPSLSESFNEFCSSFNSICNEWLQQGLKNYSDRRQEISDYTSCSEKLITDELQQARTKAFAFSHRKQNILFEIGLLNQSRENEKSLDKISKHANVLNDEINSCWQSLLSLEMDLAVTLEKMYEIFESTLKVMTEEFAPKIKNFSARLQSCSNQFMDTAVTYFSEWGEKTSEEKQQAIRAAESDSGTLDPELLELLKKEQATIREILDTGRSRHISVLQSREKALSQHLTSWLDNTLTMHSDAKIERHRQRVIEITTYCRTARNELQAMCKYCDVS